MKINYEFEEKDIRAGLRVKYNNVEYLVGYDNGVKCVRYALIELPAGAVHTPFRSRAALVKQLNGGYEPIIEKEPQNGDDE